MSNLKVLHELFERAGPLRDVWVARFEGNANFVTEAKLSFDGVALVVAAGDLDTMAIRVGDPVKPENTTMHNVNVAAPWSAALGLALRWGWELTNHQGYADGVRFEFADSDAGISVAIEVIVMASMLHVYRCEPSPRSAA